MKPLETRATREVRERKNKTLLGLFIIAIMIFSGIGYALWQRQPAEQENVRKYNNHTFIRTERGWQTEVIVDDENLPLISIYLPEELENISTEGKLSLSDFKNKVLYLVADDNDELQAAVALDSALRQFADRAQLACSEQEADETFCLENNLPIKSCEDASMGVAIIFIEERESEGVEEEEQENGTSIRYKEGCLIIKGKGIELLMAAEKIVFMIFGVM